MVLTNAQTVVFFEHAQQMSIPHATVIQLQNEGISSVDDLTDFDKDTLQQVANSLRRPGGRIPDPTVGGAAGATIATPSFIFGAKSRKRRLSACDIVRYYEATGRALSPDNITWNTVIKNFAEQWKALKDRKSEDAPEVPKITQALPIIKWTEAFADYLHSVIGVRTIPLAYVIRDVVEVPEAAPGLLPGQPHSEEHGSVEAELIARSYHNHALYRDDNANVYYKLEEATRTTSYAASIKPFQRAKDGRAAWLALSHQYAGDDKWEQELKKQDDLLHMRIWRGQSNFTLERFVQQHRNAFVSMQSCAEHIEYQLPTEHTRVAYLLTGIQCNDAGLQAAMASVKIDTGPNGKRGDFEGASSHLLPYDHVARKRHDATQKRWSAEILDSTGADISSFGAKEGIGSSEVHLRYHKPDEYDTLGREQKDELRKWRKTSKGGKRKAADKKQFGSRPNPKRVKNDKAMAAAVTKEVDKRFAAARKDKEDAAPAPTKDEARAYIMALLEDNTKKAEISGSCQAQDSNSKEYYQQGEEFQELNRTVDASEPFHFSIEEEKEYSPCITDGQ
jgi:hypothetical protein